MPDPGLINYTRNAQAKGVSAEEITVTLRRNGQDEEQIRLIFDAAIRNEQEAPVPLSPDPNSIDTTVIPLKRNIWSIRCYLRYAFWILIAILIVAFFMRDRLPPKEDIRAEISRDPVQEVTTKAPFYVSSSNGNDFLVTPLYSYDIVGLVVSQSGTDTILDYFHNVWRDSLNLKDVCMVWGETALSGIYQDMQFKNGSWTCYYGFNNSMVQNYFTENELSNNHLLTISPQVQKVLKSVRRGDQIRIIGYLSNYRSDIGPRGTSITRTDRGNGACETIYISEIQIIYQANFFWKNLYTISAYMIFFVIILRTSVYFFMVHERVQKAKINDN